MLSWALKSSTSSLKVQICTIRSRDRACCNNAAGLLELQSHRNSSSKPTPVAYLFTSSRSNIYPAQTRQFLGSSEFCAQYLTVPQSNECRQMGQILAALSMVWMSYFCSSSKIVLLISTLYRSRYICESLASIKIPASLPSGFLLPWCCLLKSMTIQMTSLRSGNVNWQSKMASLPGAWSCLMVRVFSSLTVNLSVHQSVLLTPSQTLVSYRVANYGLVRMSVILVRQGSCMTSNCFSLVYTTSNSMKSAPWQRAAQNDWRVFSGRMEARPRWAMLRGLPACWMQGARLGRVLTATSKMMASIICLITLTQWDVRVGKTKVVKITGSHT